MELNTATRATSARELNPQERGGSAAADGTGDAGAFGSMLQDLRSRWGGDDEQKPAPAGPADAAQAMAPFLAPAPPPPRAPEARPDADSHSPATAGGEARQAPPARESGNAAERAEKSPAAMRDKAESAEAEAAAAATDTAFADAMLLAASAGEARNADTSLPMPDAAGRLPDALAAQPMMGQAPATAAGNPAGPASPPPIIPIAAPPASPAFAGEFSESIRLLAGKGIQAAELRLTPGELGPVDVRIEIRDGRADISLKAQSPEALSAIQQSLPRLAEALSGAGITLGETSVDQQQRDPARDRHPSGGEQGTPGQSRQGSPLAGAGAAPLVVARRGLIDLYA